MTEIISPNFPSSLIDPDAVQVVRLLQDDGHEAYFVGGSVRDLLLGLAPQDIDIATSASPEEVKRVFGRRCRLIGRRFRLAHVYHGSKLFEVATFRGLPDDQEHAEDDSGFVVRANTFGTAEQDARSRDFTINGLFYHPIHNELIDHVKGLADLEQRVLRTIGPADIRLREDPVRLLRAIKFAARMDLRLDSAITDIAHDIAPLIQTCPASRVAEELYRISEAGHTAEAWRMMHEFGVIEALLPEAAERLADPEVASYSFAFYAELDRLVHSHGTLPRETTFALVTWPLIADLFRQDPQASQKNWGRLAREWVHDFAIRMSIPIRHRDSLGLMAHVLKSFHCHPERRPNGRQLLAPALPLALTVARMDFLITGEGESVYERWARPLQDRGIFPGPALFERKPAPPRDTPSEPRQQRRSRNPGARRRRRR